MLHTSPLAAIQPMATKTSVTPNMLAYSALAVMVIFDDCLYEQLGTIDQHHIAKEFPDGYAGQ